MNEQLRHFEKSNLVPATAEKIFGYVDDHARFSSHMSSSSWMMGGGSMKVAVDEGRGQKVGSHIRLDGVAFGIPISLDEVVTRHEPPRIKTWETVGEPNLLIIGHYIMGVDIKSLDNQSRMRVFIDYDLPARHPWLGQLFGGIYARWCVQQMLDGVQNAFKATS